MSEGVNFRRIDERWQAEWERADAFHTANPGEPGAARPKYFILDFFPYPSGAGLHVGHPLGYIATDIIARYKRMSGFNVLHPMGFDSFGLPAEQYAIETGVHPRITTERNIATYERQLRMIGLSYDWKRKLATTDVGYYKWTQWIFLQIYHSWFDPEWRWTDRAGRAMVGKARPISELPIPKHVRDQGSEEVALYQADHRLAYLAEVPVNWCPALGTVLANEEVTADGRSERGNFPVFRRPMKQWMLRITEYADRLLRGLDWLDWPEAIKLQQRNWIGRSEGAYVDFRIDQGQAAGQVIRVFTTRPDTLFGSTYLVLAPEHRLVELLVTPERRTAVQAYVEQARQRSDQERTKTDKTKTGVFTGAYAVNPVNGEPVPLWVADYVLAGYGTGSIMAVPAHDERDYEFAKELGLPIRDVIYSRIVLAMSYFAEYAAPEQAGDDWRIHLADFLGLISSTDAPPERFGETFRVVQSRRRSAPTETEAAAQLNAAKARGGPPRGVIRANWLETLEAQDFESFAQFRELFRRGHYFAHIGSAYTDAGINVHSRSERVSIDGLHTPEAKQSITAWLESCDLGERTVQFKLRDWLFSRQRYWGEPFPIAYADNGEIVALEERELPVTLPELADFRPTASDDPAADPQTPLSRAGDWMTLIRDGRKLRREVNTMPNWAGSCWYYLRFCDPSNDAALIAPAVERYWAGLPTRDAATARPGAAAAPVAPAGLVDLYLGGAEHAVLHLLYARFWHAVLYDLGHVSTPEPFQRLFNQGMIGAAAYVDERGAYVEAVEVVDADGRPAAEVPDSPGPFFYQGRPVRRELGKMGKSLKNVVNPDTIIAEYGADTLRLYEMYMGPLEASKPWNTRDIVGVHRFLQRVWRLVLMENPAARAMDSRDQLPGISATAAEDGAAEVWILSGKLSDADNPALERALHKTIKKVTQGMDAFAFNTSIAQMIVWVNEATKAETLGRSQIARFLRLLAPFAPHVSEELHQRLGGAGLIAQAEWPTWDEALTADEAVEYAIQINGKVRARVQIPAAAGEEQIIADARQNETVARELSGKPLKRTIVVKGRLVNFIV